jgi:hypothetical protein
VLCDGLKIRRTDEHFYGTPNSGPVGRWHYLSGEREYIAAMKSTVAVERHGEEPMLNATELLAEALGAQLASAYARAFSGREPRYTEVIAEAARLVLERIGSSDALYHSCEHTALVALVGQDILRAVPGSLDSRS